jgi:signal transduction histidine kinase
MQMELYSPVFKRDYEIRMYRPEPDRVALVFNDISERKKAEERALMAQKMEAIGRLAGGIAHDFNNLLTVVTGHARLALGRLPDGDAGRESIEEILKAGEKASGLTTQLLAISKRQAREPEVLDLNEAISGFRSILGHLAGQNVDVVMRRSETPKVRADRSQVEQLLLNLVVNARDAMPDGGRMSIETSSCVLDREAALQAGVTPGSYAMLAVRDTGVGIDPEVMPHIFEPFYSTKEGKGTGLGLSTVYGIAKQNGGAVTVESELGRGACFRVLLPRWTEVLKASEPKRVEDGKKRVLLAEDQEDVRRFAAAALRHFGHQVIEAEDGERALELCADGSVEFDCLVADIEMPEMRGTELAVRVRALRPGVGVVLMSGYAEEMDADKDANGFGPPLRKPFAAEALSKRVQSAT